MKHLALSLLLLASTFAQEVEQPPLAELDPAQAALERMLSERESPKALELAIADARKQGATAQAILEARFIFHVDRHEDAELAAMLPLFVAQQKKFKLSESQIFAVEEDWLAVVEYIHAIAALQKNDRDAFKKHITEAFWLSPQQGAAFAPHIDRLRLEEAMRKVKIDFTLPLLDLAGNKTNLSSFTQGKKAILLHFFSPWSRECEASMPDFAAAATEMTSKGIAVVSILGDDAPGVVEDTEALLNTLPNMPPGSWLVDNLDTPLSQLLRVQSVPVMVLVALDGKILYNGHPADDLLWKELARVAPGIARPPLADGGP